MMYVNHHFEDFTETGYRELLKKAKDNWSFINYPEHRKPGNVCLWRHDIDFSVHRAYRLAQIEAEEDIKSTFFIHLHSQFYNPLESEVRDLILNIIDLGHDLGLHFDPAFYIPRMGAKDDFIDFMKLEKQFLSRIFQTNIKAFSFHNPDTGPWLDINQDNVAGMTNAYGKYIKKHYTYCTDSNGYWRFQRLRDVLEARRDEKIHVLTHPAWWVPDVLSPRQRISRCIDGRAASVNQYYDHLLEKYGRENVR